MKIEKATKENEENKNSEFAVKFISNTYPLHYNC